MRKFSIFNLEFSMKVLASPTINNRMIITLNNFCASKIHSLKIENSKLKI